MALITTVAKFGRALRDRPLIAAVPFFVGVVMLASSSHALAGSSQSFSAFVDHAGTKSNISQGQVIAQGSPVPGGCSLDSAISIGGRFTSAGEGISGSVTTHFNDKCQLVVESITTESVNAPSHTPHASPLPTLQSPSQLDPISDCEAYGTLHYGWAKNTITEQFGITATEVYVEMKYNRLQDTVCGGLAPSYYDYNSNWPCWSHNNVSYTWEPDGPDMVWISRNTHFHNCTGNIDYNQFALFAAYPDPSYACSLPQGALPTGWHMQCAGGTYY